MSAYQEHRRHIITPPHPPPHTLHQISGMRSSSTNAHLLGHHGGAGGGGREGGAGAGGGGGGGGGGDGDRGMADGEQLERLKKKETKPLIQEL